MTRREFNKAAKEWAAAKTITVLVGKKYRKAWKSWAKEGIPK